MVEWAIVLLAGLGTLLMRVLPLRRALRGRGLQGGPVWLQKLAAASGPAAMAALLVAGVAPALAGPAAPREALATAVALAAMVGVRRWLGAGMLVPTLVGAGVYGGLVTLLHGLA